jgi:hypothetical protein
MSDKDKQLIIDALDTLACILTDYNHQWTDEERQLYEKAISLLT